MTNTKKNLSSKPHYTAFPSPADDFLEKKLDLNKRLIKHPAATFFIKVTGNGMSGCGIQTGDLLIVDRGLSARNGSIIVAILDNNFTVKRLVRNKGQVRLISENSNQRSIPVIKNLDFEVWGVVTFVIKKFHDQ